MSLPPPHDDDAEQELACAVASGVPPSALRVSARDFFNAFFRQVYAAAEALEARDVLPTPERIAVAMRERGAVGPIAEEVERIVDFTPLFHVRRIEHQAHHVRELARRRDLLASLARIDAGLRTDQLTCDKAIALVKRAAEAAKA